VPDSCAQLADGGLGHSPASAGPRRLDVGTLAKTRGLVKAQPRAARTARRCRNAASGPGFGARSCNPAALGLACAKARPLRTDFQPGENRHRRLCSYARDSIAVPLVLARGWLIAAFGDPHQDRSGFCSAGWRLWRCWSIRLRISAPTTRAERRGGQAQRSSPAYRWSLGWTSLSLVHPTGRANDKAARAHPAQPKLPALISSRQDGLITQSAPEAVGVMIKAQDLSLGSFPVVPFPAF
jgi:hypothetical protein